jgi:pyruvate dehydrogenase E2 component (dihydrolipoamide acetyltransferase)
MIECLRIPQLSANIEQAAVTAWLKPEGASVTQGEPIVELTTEKACFECEAPASGTLLKVLAAEKSVLPVGYVIALIGDPGDPTPDVDAENQALIERQVQHTPIRRRRTDAAAAPRATRVRATPAARRVARELGVDLATLADAAGDQPINENMVRRQAAEGQA